MNKKIKSIGALCLTTALLSGCQSETLKALEIVKEMSEVKEYVEYSDTDFTIVYDSDEYGLMQFNLFTEGSEVTSLGETFSETKSDFSQRIRIGIDVPETEEELLNILSNMDERIDLDVNMKLREGKMQLSLAEIEESLDTLFEATVKGMEEEEKAEMTSRYQNFKEVYLLETDGYDYVSIPFEELEDQGYEMEDFKYSEANEIIEELENIFKKNFSGFKLLNVGMLDEDTIVYEADLDDMKEELKDFQKYVTENREKSIQGFKEIIQLTISTEKYSELNVPESEIDQMAVEIVETLIDLDIEESIPTDEVSARLETEIRRETDRGTTFHQEVQLNIQVMDLEIGFRTSAKMIEGLEFGTLEDFEGEGLNFMELSKDVKNTETVYSEEGYPVSEIRNYEDRPITEGNSIILKYMYDGRNDVRMYVLNDSSEEVLDRIYVENKLIDNRLYLPLRKISEALGEDLVWDNETKQIYANTPEGRVDIAETVVVDGVVLFKIRDFEKLGYSVKYIHPEYNGGYATVVLEK